MSAKGRGNRREALYYLPVCSGASKRAQRALSCKRGESFIILVLYEQRPTKKQPVPDWLTPKVYKPSKPQLQIPRLPTPKEQKQVIDYVMKKDNLPKVERSNITSLFFDGDCPVAVFDHYVTYGLTYTGKLLVVVGDMNPYQTTCFIWKKDGSIEEVTRSTMKQLKKEIWNSTM